MYKCEDASGHISYGQAPCGKKENKREIDNPVAAIGMGGALSLRTNADFQAIRLGPISNSDKKRAAQECRAVEQSLVGIGNLRFSKETIGADVEKFDTLRQLKLHLEGLDGHISINELRAEEDARELESDGTIFRIKLALTLARRRVAIMDKMLESAGYYIWDGTLVSNPPSENKRPTDAVRVAKSYADSLVGLGRAAVTLCHAFKLRPD